ncbi:MAG: phosphoribosylaminoimidazolesuccinocarboxamide synthase [Legionellales bacterium]|nr:MAG: phosphoribosylaminoimidazolesuccinocarboxamide synthase [Legionellales bacterium]
MLQCPLAIQEILKQNFNKTIESTNLPYNKVNVGKVRDIYEVNNDLLLVSTDRLSAFDRHLCTIPFKGKVLTALSAWWFAKTKHIIANHFISLPHPNCMQVKKCKVLPIEVVVRGYLTGSTNTSIWCLYQQGQRKFADITLPDNLHKNMPLPQLIITPTTKDAVHDAPITEAEIVKTIMSKSQWKFIKTKALELFSFSQSLADKSGLILVDTKYEFGIDDKGNIILIDECHTADSSRYWLRESYTPENHNEEPQSFDKEIMRLWYKKNSNPYEDKILPEAPQEKRIQLAYSYIKLYELLTNNTFDFTIKKLTELVLQ